MLDLAVKTLNEKVPGCNAEILKKEVGDSPIVVAAEKILQVCQVLKDDVELDFQSLEVISGVDFLKKEASDKCPAQEERIEVNYMLTSFAKKHDLILKVKLGRSNPELDSVCAVWRSADFQERECYDMLGVNFKGHPDMRRILCPEDWEGFPLRQDYVVQKEWHGMEVNPESKMNLEDRAFEAINEKKHKKQ